MGLHTTAIDIDCTSKTIIINGKEITWNRFVKLIEEVIPPYQVAVQERKTKKNLFHKKKGTGSIL